MLKIIFLALNLWASAEISHRETVRINNILTENQVATSSTLSRLAHTQCLSIIKVDKLTELDDTGHTFADRTKSAGLNPKRIKLNEFYFRGPRPMEKEFMDEILKIVQRERFTHCGIGVRYVDGYYFTVITVGNFGVYV